MDFPPPSTCSQNFCWVLFGVSEIARVAYPILQICGCKLLPQRVIYGVHAASRAIARRSPHASRISDGEPISSSKLPNKTGTSQGWTMLQLTLAPTAFDARP